MDRHGLCNQVHGSVHTSVVLTCEVAGFPAVAHQRHMLELLLNASAQLLAAPPLPLIVCDL